jgi:hypothetical protein
MLSGASVGGGGGLSYTTGLLLWLKPETGLYKDAGVTPVSADGDEVQQWNDQSGNGFHGTSTAAGHIPHYRTSEQNRLKNLVEFASIGGVNNYQGLTLPSGLNAALIAAGAAHYFIVLRNLAGNTAKERGGWWFSTASGGEAFTWSDGHIYETFGRSAQLDVGVPGVDLSDSFRVLEVISASNHYNVTLAGVSKFNSTAAFTPSFPSSVTSRLSIGEGNPALTSRWGLDARVSEVLIYNHEVTGSNLTTVRTYLT